MPSESAMTKLPEHDKDVYAVHEMARHGPTNKTMISIKKAVQNSRSDAFGKNKLSVPAYPILDVQKRKIVDKESNLHRLESHRYKKINANNSFEHRSSTISPHDILSPSNPRPVQYQK